MKLYSAAQMRELDAFVINTLRIPGASFMRRASRHVAGAARELLAKSERGSVVVFCGIGNNGGDGFGAAADLVRDGVSMRVFLLGKRENMSADSLEMERRLIEYGGKVEAFEAAAAFEAVENCGVIIDAIFGTGLKRPVSGDAIEAVDIINASKATVVSADIPSGVHADTGEILGACVQADVTVTFSGAKPGLFLTPGCVSAGEVRVCDIGIPPELTDGVKSDIYAVQNGDISLPKRARDSHKGDFGRVLIIAGSLGYTGAPVMAAHACSMAGAGLVSLGVPDDIYQIIAQKCTGEMPFRIKGGETVSEAAWEELLPRVKAADAVLIGPGMRNTPDTQAIVAHALRESDVPVILDADGINVLAGNIDILDNAKPPVVLTPHDGEFARITGNMSAGGRLGVAREFAKKHGCVVILKGYRTITALPDGSAFINTTGNPGLAKGGSGDVLAGVLAALVGQGFPLKDACIAAVYLHGLAGDMATSRFGEYSVTPEGVINEMPQAFLTVTSQGVPTRLINGGRPLA